VVVASGCAAEVLSAVKRIADSDARVLMISEPNRRGKVEAINRILDNSAGEHLVLVNSDAVPEQGSVRKLLAIAAEDDRVGCVSACPVFGQKAGLFQDSLGLMWSAHNLLSLHLNHAGISNHSSDELLLVRRSLLSRLPPKLVNDGAYLGGLIKSKGFKVRFCEDARVRIAVPARVDELVAQRRRILFGHVQVWKELGSPPHTMESLIFRRPLLILRLLVMLLARRPRSILALFVVATSEAASTILAMIDWAVSTDRHTVWKRFER
jgi:cellulose synthase/poly-beta-1,6-N-acetylglucosamine synthase-like glycosyltransferase